MIILWNKLKGTGGSGGGGAIGKIKILNVVGTGELTRNGAVYSGFSDSNYLELANRVNGGFIDYSDFPKDCSVLSSASTIEITVKFKTGNDVSTFQNIIGWKETVDLYIESGALKIWSESGDTSVSCGSVSANTVYWAKVIINGNNKTISYSTDGTTYIGEQIIEDTANTFDALFKIGFTGSTASDTNTRYFRGEIDIADWEIEVDNEIWWKGVEEVVASGDIDLPSYLKKPAIITDADNTNLSVTGNTVYKFGTALTSLTISSVETSDYESIIYFTTGTGTISLSAPNTLRWGGGNEQPALEPNTVYCIAIRNGLAEIDNFGSAS